MPFCSSENSQTKLAALSDVSPADGGAPVVKLRQAPARCEPHHGIKCIHTNRRPLGSRPHTCTDGDIEAIIEGMAKAAAAAGGKEMLKGFAKGLFSGNLDVDSIKKGGATFKAADVKQIYFGNWLRDFSQVKKGPQIIPTTSEGLLQADRERELSSGCGHRRPQQAHTRQSHPHCRLSGLL